VALTRPAVGALRRGRSVVGVVQTSSTSRLPGRKAGIRSIEGASAQRRLAPNPCGRQGCLAHSQPRPFRRSWRARDEVEARSEQLRATEKRQSTMRAGVGSLSRRAQRVGDMGKSRRRATRERAKPSWRKTTLFSRWGPGARTPSHIGEADGTRQCHAVSQTPRGAHIG